MGQRPEVDLEDSERTFIEKCQTWFQIVLFVIVASAMSLLTTQVHADTTPTSFEFHFHGAPPGWRYWTVQGNIWTETYSTGQKSTFRVKKYPYQTNGLNGTLVQKVDEPDFFVFISDIHDSKMEVWTNKAKGPWRPLAKPGEFGPKQF